MHSFLLMNIEKNDEAAERETLGLLHWAGDWNLQEWKMTDHQKTRGVEFAGLENDSVDYYNTRRPSINHTQQEKQRSYLRHTFSDRSYIMHDA